MDKLYIVIPAYNESENIKEVIEEWYPIVEAHNPDGQSLLVIIDDGSTDNTFSIIEEEAKNRPYLYPLHKENGGHGSAVLAGYRFAIEQKADYIFQTDSDRQTTPKEFEGFWRQRERFDMVIGNRRGREDGFSRFFVTKSLKLLLLCEFQVYVADANTPYRLMKREVLEQYIDLVEEDEALPNIMLSIIYAKKKRKVLYKDITFRQRQGGVNSLDMAKIKTIGTSAMERFYRLKRRLSE